MSDFFADHGHPKARKQHRCNICYRVIEVGEHYRNGASYYDGRFSAFKECAHCEAIWSLYRPEDGDGLISEEGYDTWQLEGYGESMPTGEHAAITQLRHRVQFRRRWRRRDGTLYPIPKE